MRGPLAQAPSPLSGQPLHGAQDVTPPPPTPPPSLDPMQAPRPAPPSQVAHPAPSAPSPRLEQGLAVPRPATDAALNIAVSSDVQVSLVVSSESDDQPCGSDQPSDGDQPSDSDQPSDGDLPCDGDLPSDGDQPSDQLGSRVALAPCAQAPVSVRLLTPLVMPDRPSIMTVPEPGAVAALHEGPPPPGDLNEPLPPPQGAMSPSSSHDGVLVPLQEAEPHGLPSLACFSQEHLPLSHLPQEPHGGVTLQGVQASAALPYASREELAAFHDPQPHDELTLQDVVAVRGVGALLVSFLPLVQRVRLRSLCRSLCAAVDESLESLLSVAGDDLAGASGDGTRALAWLTAKCRNLVALGPLKGYRRDKGGAAWVKTFDVLDPSRMTTSVASSAPALTAGNGSLSAGGDAVGDGRGGDEEGSVRRRDDGSDDGKYYDQYVAAHRLRYSQGEGSGHGDGESESSGERGPRGRRVEWTSVNGALLAAAAHCRHLRYMDVRRCGGVLQEGIVAVARACPELRHLDIAWIRDTARAGEDASSHSGGHASMGYGGMGAYGGMGSYGGMGAYGSMGPYGAMGPYVGMNDGGGQGSGHSGAGFGSGFGSGFGGGMHGYFPSPTVASAVSSSQPRHVADDSIKSIALGCRSLVHLDVTGCRGIGDTGIAAIGEHCPLLEHLSAGYCPKVTDGSISMVAERCARLRHLDVGGCSGVTDAGIGLVLERCTELEDLVVHKCMRVTDRSITAIGRASSSTMNTSTLALPALPAAYLPLNADPDGPAMFGSGSSHGRSDHGSRVRANASDGPRKLRQLDLGGCHQVTDASVSAVARNCPHLQVLQLGGCGEVTDASVGLLAGNCPSLRELGLARCAGVTDGSLKRVGESCPRLVHLDLAGCHRVTDESIRAVGENCRGLEHLDITKCWYVTDASIGVVVGNCRRLRSVSADGSGVTRESIKGFVSEQYLSAP